VLENYENREISNPVYEMLAGPCFLIFSFYTSAKVSFREKYPSYIGRDFPFNPKTNNMQFSGKKKITELYGENFRSQETRDANGQLQRTRVPYRGARLVNVVDGWDRFWHYLIDAVIIGIVAFIIGIISEVGRQSGLGMLSYQNGHLEVNFIGPFLSFFFYFLFELTTGSTPGKMIFGRVVINEYAEKPDAGMIALRSISRMVPFEGFSCLGERGWHDKWSKTFVVHKSEAALLYDLRQQQEREEVQKISDDFRSQSGTPVQ
jgi:uncharacterized RDD family membrane protein YckC